MMVEALYYTGRGKVREKNEDSLVVGDIVFNRGELKEIGRRTLEGNGLVFAVADGMGGYPGGDIASGVIVNELEREKASIGEALERSRMRMREIGLENRILSHMGSVVSGIQLEAERVKVFNVGDSRTYFYRDSLKQVTEDDSYVWELLAGEGLSSDELHEEIRHHYKKNIVTSALTGERGRYNFVEKVMEAEVGDRYLICSDGLWEEMEYSFIEECMGMEIWKGARRLLERASVEARDNISFIIVEIKSK